MVGMQVWRSALLMGDFIIVNRDIFTNNQVMLELGSGVGLTGIVAAMYCKEVIFTGEHNNKGTYTVLSYTCMIIFTDPRMRMIFSSMTVSPKSTFSLHPESYNGILKRNEVLSFVVLYYNLLSINKIYAFFVYDFGFRKKLHFEIILGFVFLENYNSLPNIVCFFL